jgi:hypothetical protein
MSDEDEKWHNMLVFSMPLTNKELEEIAPFLAVTAVVLIIILLLLNSFSNDQTKEPKQKPAIEQSQ